MEKGIKKGREEGMEKGISEATKKIAIALMDKKVPMPLIEECTGLTLDEILDIKNEQLKSSQDF